MAVEECGEGVCYIQLDTEQVSGLYQVMSELVYADMEKQFKEKRISGSTYADTWAKLMDSVVAGSMSTIAQLQMKETEMDKCVKQSQCDLTDAQAGEVSLKSAREECLSTAECSLKAVQQSKVNYEIENVLPAQVDFTVRQTEGFDDNKNQKLLEIQMNAWAMMYSSGLMTDMENGGVPRIINDDEVSDLYDLMSPV